MSTTAQTFFLDIVDDDQTGGTVIKKNAESAPTATSSTTCTWTTVTVETRTHIPLTGTTTNSDTSNANGWCHNNGGTDGLGSTSTAERWIKPGVWNFSMAYTLNAPAVLQTIACTVTAKVYRVATGGGTRTLLFTATSANFAATATITWASTSQPEYVLAAGEVIQVGFTASSAATKDALNAITNTVLTLNQGANSWFQVPTPGVKTLSEGAGASAGSGALAAAFSKVLGTAYASSGTGAATLVGAPRVAGTFALAGVGAASLLGSSVSASVFISVGTGALATAGGKVLGSNYAMNSGALTPDWPVVSATKAISGIVTNSGTAQAGATCRLMRDSDNFMCQTTTTDGTGAYSFSRDALDPYTYHVEVYVGTTLHGLTDRGLVPA